MELALLYIALGFVGGCIGGMLGLGGGILIIPLLTMASGPDQNLYQAALMIVYVVISFSATLRHHKAKAIRFDVLKGLVPASIVMILVGVWFGNHLPEPTLRLCFGLYIAYVIVMEFRRLVLELRFQINSSRRLRSKGSTDQSSSPLPSGSSGSRIRSAVIAVSGPDPVPVVRSGFVGALMGLVSGLLGIGGGTVAVPLQQSVCHLPIRQSIATSSAAMLFAGTIGAIAKNTTLLSTTVGVHPVMDSIRLALAITPGAIVGGYTGAALTHRLPTAVTRTIFILMLCLSLWKMVDWGMVFASIR